MLLSHLLTEHTSVNGWRSPSAQINFVGQFGKRSTHRSSNNHARASAASPDVIVVGGGAAGLTAAYFAASAGAQVGLRSFARSRIERLVLCSMPQGGIYNTKLILLAKSQPGHVVQVTVLERSKEAGSKVLISGGTRWYALLGQAVMKLKLCV